MKAKGKRQKARGKSRARFARRWTRSKTRNPQSAFRIPKSAIAFFLCLLLCAPAPALALRLISLAPSVTETLFAIGAGGDVVGVSNYCDYPPEVESIDRIGTFLAPNLELIVSKRPDLVVGVPSPGNRDTVRALERLGLEVLVVDPETVGEIVAATEKIAAAAGRDEAGTALANRIRARITEIEAKLEGVEPRRVLMVVGHSPLVGVGDGVLQNELIRRARGMNLGEHAGGQWPRLSLEWVLSQRPEVIIDTSMDPDERSGMEFWKSFPDVPAVRDGRIYGYRDFALLRPGPRVAEAFERFARFIHPERFE